MARLTAAKAYYQLKSIEGIASLISHFAMSLISRPARFRAMGIAILGAIVKSMGFVAASPHATTLASGLTDEDCDLCAVVRTNAEAPSFIEDAFAAVTVPSFLSCYKDGKGVYLNAGFNAGTFSSFIPLYSSSTETSTSPFLLFMVTGTISSLKTPASQASAARRYLH